MPRGPRATHPAVTLGVWGWGAAAAVLATAITTLMVITPLYLVDDTHFKRGAPSYIVGAYFMLKNCGAIVGAIVALGGLVWAHFFATATHAEEVAPDRLPPAEIKVES